MKNDVETQRGVLEAELMRIGMNPGMPDLQTQLRRNARIVEIQGELAALPRAPQPPRPPPGRRIVFDGRLGTDAFKRPEAARSHHADTDYNPFDAVPSWERE